MRGQILLMPCGVVAPDFGIPGRRVQALGVSARSPGGGGVALVWCRSRPRFRVVRLPADDLLSVWRSSALSLAFLAVPLLLDRRPVARGLLVPVSIKEAVLGFLLCEVGDLSMAGSSRPGWSVEFRKASSANVTVNRCVEFAGFGGIRSCAPMLLFRPFGSRVSGAKICSVLPVSGILVHGVIGDGEYHEGRLED